MGGEHILAVRFSMCTYTRFKVYVAGRWVAPPISLATPEAEIRRLLSLKPAPANSS
jgi:hypothetical protein